MALGDNFLKLDGIDGESTVDGHENEIDIDSISLGVVNTGTGDVGGGSGGGRSDFHDISMTKLVDSSSAALWLACATGQHIDSAVITCRKSGGDALDYLKISLKEVFVSSVQSSIAGGSNAAMESISLNFSEIKMEYQKQKEDGTGEPAGEMGFNVKKNKKV